MDGKFWFKALLTVLLLTTLVMAGCDDGDDGRDGAQGPPGPPGQDASQVVNVLADTDRRQTVDIEITDVSVSSPPVVSFTATTPAGLGVVALCDYRDSRDRGALRFSMAKLIPGDKAAGVQSQWADYVNGERNQVGTCVDNGDGTYVYTFEKDLGEYDPAITFDPALVHRLAIQQSSIPNVDPINAVEDFIPAGGEVTPGVQNRDIVTIEACNSCHGELAFHGSGRFLTEYCVVCHNPTLAEGEGEFTFMVHTIHSAGTFAVLDDGVDYSEVTYPQDLRNCATCHKGADSTAWTDLQNANVCTQCHEGVVGDIFPHTITSSTPACSVCHPAIAPALDIAALHTTVNATANNPDVPAGLVNFTYELLSASVDAANVATIEFRLLADGVALNALPAEADFTGDPDLLFAYAMPQEGILAPADFNNLGRTAAQPQTVGLKTLGANLTNTAGVFTAVVPDAFPVGSTLRTVGLQAYFTQVTPNEARHTTSDVITVTDDEVRRSVVSSEKCAACHEFFEAHGGNRVFSFDGGVQICTTCHVPNLSSSGTTLDLAFPEDTNNFKDLIHGIHAATDRPYEFVRNFRDAARFYDWSEVTFPGILSNCNTCHLENTYVLDELPTGLLSTTVEIPGTDDPETTAGVIAARANVPNDTDFVNTPISSACFYCHDSDAAASHMELNGGQIDVLRAEVDATLESCIVCHGEGAAFDITLEHGL